MSNTTAKVPLRTQRSTRKNRLSEVNCENFNLHLAKGLLDEHGYLIVRNILNTKIVNALQQELFPYFDARPRSQGLFWGKNTTRIEAILNKSQTAQDLVTHQLILDCAKHILAENCDSIQLHLTQGIRIHPGEQAQALHPDSAMFPIPKPFEFMFNVIWALSDFTKDNGATHLVPGSHRWEAEREPQEHEVIQAEMKAGDALLYTASLLHGGGANLTENTDRTGLAISYSLGWLRQSENMYLTYPPEVAKHFSSQLQHLLGYDVHRPNLGWVNGHHPTQLLSTQLNEDIGAEDFLTDEQNQMLREYLSGQQLAVNYEGKAIKDHSQNVHSTDKHH